MPVLGSSEVQKTLQDVISKRFKKQPRCQWISFLSQHLCVLHHTSHICSFKQWHKCQYENL